MSENKSQHTPGPWTQNADTVWMSERQCAVVSTHDGARNRTRANHSDDCAKARLIAAAPELLEAEEDAAHTLQTITEICDALATWEHDMPLPVRQKITHIANIAEQARAKSGKAISKAKGGEV